MSAQSIIRVVDYQSEVKILHVTFSNDIFVDMYWYMIVSGISGMYFFLIIGHIHTSIASEISNLFHVIVLLCYHLAK